jgi:hypothetical protein
MVLYWVEEVETARDQSKTRPGQVKNKTNPVSIIAYAPTKIQLPKLLMSAGSSGPSIPENLWEKPGSRSGPSGYDLCEAL